MTAADYLGSGRSFYNRAEGQAAQLLVSHGFKHCIRRVYFLTLTTPAERALRQNRLAEFMKAGKIHHSAQSLASAVKDIKAKLAAMPSDGQEPPPFAHVDVALSYEGMVKLGFRQSLLDVFRRKSPAFYDTAYARAARHLGDTGPSDIQYWTEPYLSRKRGGGFDVALIAHIGCEEGGPPFTAQTHALSVLETALKKNLTGIDHAWAQPLEGSWIEVAAPLDDEGHEHFGYRDGITTPVYMREAPSSAPDTPPPDFKVQALGEILLGHPRNDGDNPYADLGITPRRHADWEPHSVPKAEAEKAFFKNSSFGVLRRMEQRVEMFDQWVTAQCAQNFAQDATQVRIEPTPKNAFALGEKFIRSKLMGRTPEGLRLRPDMQLKDFMPKEVKRSIAAMGKQWGWEGDFHHRDTEGRPTPLDDSQGQACPFSSHIRRMNPQDDPVTPFIHRPVLRRGLPYTDATGKGMAGLFICADILEQFEHLAGAWGQQSVLGIPDPSRCRDPLIGQHQGSALDSRGNRMAIVGVQGEKKSLEFTEPFVITKGCAYVWFPSVDTLQRLGDFATD